MRTHISKNMKDKLSFYSLVPHLKGLRFVGYYQMDTKAPAIKRMIHKVYSRVVLSLMTTCLIQQCMKLYEVRSNSVQVMDTVFLCLTYANTLYKIYTIRVRAPLVEELLDTMKGPLFNQGVPSHNVMLRGTCRHGLLLLRSFQCLSISTVLCWSIYPVVLHLRGTPTPFGIWLPFDASVDPQFYIVVVYTWIQDSFVAMGNSTMDSFISFIFVQAKTQLAILRLDLEELVKTSTELASAKNIKLTKAINLRFESLLRHYADIDTFNRKVQEIFGTVIFLQFTLSGWILCATSIRMASMISSSGDLIGTGLYLICMLWENFLFCYYGNDLNVESEALLHSAYMMDWEQLSVSQRKDLILFMERFKRPMILFGGGIVPLTNRTFITIIRMAYSFFAFMKNSS